ncbi:MAG: hypothetical protein WCV68_00920 [Candidatus Paceibacterota bacterium]|jgi:hypothetical protein
MTRENSEQLPELKFEYSAETEMRRAKYLLLPEKRKFYLDQGYEVTLPKGLDMEDTSEISDEDLLEKINAELDFEKTEKLKLEIQEEWPSIAETLRKLFRETGYEMPETYTIQLTNYRPGGGYRVEDNSIILVFSRTYKEGWSRSRTLIHEGIHLSIEKLLFKYGLADPDCQGIKEHLVDLLMLKVVPDYPLQDRLPKEKIEEIDKIFNQHYPNIEKILEEVSKIKK